MSIYAQLKAAHQQNKLPPSGFRIADQCCINCINCYDENSITACQKWDWYTVDWFNVCDDFEGVFL